MINNRGLFTLFVIILIFKKFFGEFIQNDNFTFRIISIKTMIKYFLVIVISILVTFQGHTQIQNPVTWKYNVVKATDGTYLLKFNASIEPKWHLYNQTIPEGGPVPTSFVFEKSSAYTLTGKVRELSKFR